MSTQALALSVWYPLKELVVKPWTYRRRVIGLIAEYVCAGRTFYSHQPGPDSDEEGRFIFREWWAAHGGSSPLPQSTAEAIEAGKSLQIAGIRTAEAGAAGWRPVTFGELAQLSSVAVH